MTGLKREGLAKAMFEAWYGSVPPPDAVCYLNPWVCQAWERAAQAARKFIEDEKQ